MTVTTADRNNLQQLIQSLEQQGWLPQELLIKGTWEHTPNIETVLVHIEECDPPVLRVMRGSFEKGFHSGIIRLCFGGGVEGLINDHTLSHSFPEAIELARLDLASTSSSSSTQMGAAA